MSASLQPNRLRCEYRENPIGIDASDPRLFWQFESERNHAFQTAYQVVVSTSLSSLAQEDGDLWNSGRVDSSSSIQIFYRGVEVAPFQRAWWKVRVWDELGEASEWSAPAYWEAGLAGSAWEAQWIEDLPLGGPRTTAPSPYLRQELSVPDLPVRARLVATALGLYEFRINGSRVGEDYFAPGWTSYRKRVQYQIYDVTELIRPGANAIGAILGDGWYCGNVEWRGRQLYGINPKLRAELHLWYPDGTHQVVGTDETWRASFGPILESDMLMGESYDARRQLGAWDDAEFDDSDWRPAKSVSIEVPIVAMLGPAVRATEELTPIADPVEIPKWPAPDFLFDLGQNMVGRVRLKVKGKAGATVRLRFGEILDEKEQLYVANLRSAKQTDYYTLKGDPEGEVWESAFTFHGFRYVEMSGAVERPTRESITGIVLHSDTPKTGTFECSDPLVTQLQKNIDWGQRGNFVDIPTDCPQRDERLGWTGDAQVFIRTAAFNRDVAGFFSKWQYDLQDSQAPGGEIPPIAPNTEVVGHDGGPAWADAHIICPWTIYLCYGDLHLLSEHYDSLKAFVDSLERNSIELIRSHPDQEGFKGFGDWLSTNAETPIDLIGTAFFAYSASLMARTAELLGHAKDGERYGQLRENAVAAFQARFLDAEGRLTCSSQTAQVLALHFDLLPTEHRAAALQILVDDIESRDGHLSTGFVGTPYISQVLSENGRLDVAYRLLLQKSWPSWLYPVTKGATTIWERWDGWTDDKGFQDIGMNSFNHYAYGAIGAWLYATVAGIDVDESKPGYEHIILRPEPGGGLTSAKAGLDSIRGRIESAWELTDKSFSWTIVVPPNTTATAYVPAKMTHRIATTGEPVYIKHGAERVQYELGNGTFTFRVILE